jgi:hypothetical protein
MFEVGQGRLRMAGLDSDPSIANDKGRGEIRALFLYLPALQILARLASRGNAVRPLCLIR